MNEPLHPTHSVLARPGSGPARGPALGPNPAGSCSFDLYPIERVIMAQTLGQTVGDAELPETAVETAQLEEQESVDWDATEAHCAPTAPRPKPTLATDFIDLLIRKPVSAPYETLVEPLSNRLDSAAPVPYPIGQSISPIVSRIANPMEAPAVPEPAPPREPRSEADRLPSRDLLLQLPKVKTTRISSHRHSTNPALSLGILEDIGRVVTQWRDEIDGIHTQIQALYHEGPILEAWLESAQGSNSPSLDPAPDLSADASPSPSLNPADRKTYWICGLDEDGQPWRETCNSKDLPQVTLAIARYQTLRQLMSQKQHHEQRLNQLAKTLTVLRGRLRA